MVCRASIQLCCAGTLFTERGTIVTVFIICYALTSFVGGYVRCLQLATASTALTEKEHWAKYVMSGRLVEFQI